MVSVGPFDRHTTLLRAWKDRILEIGKPLFIERGYKSSGLVFKVAEFLTNEQTSNVQKA